MGEEEQRVFAVCREAGLEPTGLTWLAADLSLRRFARVQIATPGVATLVARIEAPEDPAGRPAGAPPEPAHEPIRALLAKHGLPVPRRYGGDAAAGIELLEDLGSLPRAPPRLGVPAFSRRLDAPLFAYKADLVVRHGLAARGRAAAPAEAAVVRDAFARIADEVARAPARLAHRDYQSGNLLVRADAPPGRRLAMIDLQGAFLAPPEYDLVCLLRDSYVALSEEEIAAHCDAVRPALPDAPAPDDFARRFDLLTLTRKGKDHARFLYAAQERGDARFLAHVPITVRALRAAAQRAAARDPHLAALAALFAELPETPCAP